MKRKDDMAVVNAIGLHPLPKGERRGRFRGLASAITGICLFLGFASLVYTQSHSQNIRPVPKEEAMTAHASGTFDVKVTPQDDKSEDASLGRFTLDKQYHGGLEGIGKGQMLTSGSAQGSGAYVAIEKVTGTLDGRKGSFVLQHSGTMTHGEAQLTITVVPDSGTGELAGIAGRMTIRIAAGRHDYEFDYTLAKTP